MKAHFSFSIIPVSVVILFIGGISLAGCKKDDSSTPNANQVLIVNMAFNPATLTVAKNTTVIWSNKDAITHTVTSDNGDFDSGDIASGKTFSYTFTNAGTFNYHCTIHPGMKGTIIVTASK